MMSTIGEQPRFLAIGTIVGVHGIRGEVKVSPLTDFPERFRAGKKVYIGTAEDASPTEIVSARPHQGMWLVMLALASDRNAAELLRDRYLLISEEEAMPLAEHENYVHDVLGIQVVTETGDSLGTLKEVLFTAANDVYVIAGPRGEVLLPALRSVILEVDVAGRRMVVRPPEGLLD